MIHTLREEMDCLEEFKAMTDALPSDEVKAQSDENVREEFRAEVKEKNKGGRPRKNTVSASDIPNSDASAEEIARALREA